MQISIRQTFTRLSQYNVGKTFMELLKSYSETKDDWDETNKMEWPGDLEELNYIINIHLQWLLHQIDPIGGSPLDQLNEMWNFVNMAQFICSPDDLEQIRLCYDFKSEYPALWHTICTWAWG